MVNGGDGTTPDKGGKDVPLVGLGQKGAPGDEKSWLLEKKRRVTLRTAMQLRLAVLVVSWLSVILLGSLGIVTFVYAVIDSSSAAFAFGFDAVLDCLSSLVVIWRFSASKGSLYSAKREATACICLGALFMISFVCILVKSVLSLVNREISELEMVLWSLYLCDGIVCAGLVCAKLILGWKLESKSIMTDAVNSFLGAFLAFASLGGNYLGEDVHNAWMMDPIVGIICALVLFFYGIWITVDSALILRRCKKEEYDSCSSS